MKGRFYPMACQSAYCGKIANDCPGCRNLPALTEFLTWKAEHRAFQPDRIWSPTYWEPTVQPPAMKARRPRPI